MVQRASATGVSQCVPIPLPAFPTTPRWQRTRGASPVADGSCWRYVSAYHLVGASSGVQRKSTKVACDSTPGVSIGMVCGSHRRERAVAWSTALDARSAQVGVRKRQGKLT